MITNTVQNEIISPSIELCLSNQFNYYLPVALFNSSFSNFAWDLIIRESFCDEEVGYLTKYISKDDTIIDIGSQFGIYPISMSKIVGENGRIFAFEEEGDMTDIISSNIKYFSLKNIFLASFSDTSFITEDLLNKCTLIRITANNCLEKILPSLELIIIKHNPLIQIDFRAKLEIIDSTINIMHKMGYTPYQYSKGLDILVPLTVETNPTCHILFFCTEDKAIQLGQTGLLASKKRPINIILPKSNNFEKWFTENFIYIRTFKHLLNDKPEGHDKYSIALCHYIDAHNSNNEDVSIKFYSLNLAYQVIRSLSNEQLNLSRSLSLARLAIDLGFVDETVNILNDIYVYLTSGQDLSLNEYFLLPSTAFESIFDPNDIGNWLLCAVIDTLIEVKYTDFKDANEVTLSLLDILEECGYLRPKMERYKQSLEIKYGLRRSLCPSPSLTLPQNDNLNSSFWKNLE